MTVTKRTRFEVLKRDDYTCRYCHATDQPLTIDRVVPVALGGGDGPSNLVAACKDCNAGKTSTSPDSPLVQQVEQDALRWRAAMARAAQQQRSKRRSLAKKVSDFAAEWNTYVDAKGRSLPLPSDHAAAVESLLVAGLSTDDLVDAVRIVMAKGWVDDRFRYFMGVCKTLLGQRMEAAQRLIAGGEV